MTIQQSVSAVTIAHYLTLDYRLAREMRDDLVFKIRLETTLGEGILGVFGESGTGKSTFLKAIAGLAKNAQYQFSMRHQNNKLSHYQDVNSTENPCVYLGAESILFDHLTVLANLQLVQKHGAFASQGKLSFDEIVALCSITNLLDQKSSALSSGERQRVMFARALLSGKPCILLDEAFSALDWRTRQHFANLVVQLHQEHAYCFVMVSHSLRELAICCTQILHLQEGTIQRVSDVDSMVNHLVDSADDEPSAMVETENVFSLLETRVNAYDAQAKLVECELLNNGDNTQTVLLRSRTPYLHGSIHRITVDADKVSLATDTNTSTSMLNCLRGVVESIDKHESVVIITLAIGRQKLRSAISIRSFNHLLIKKGDVLYALFKAL